MIGPFDSWLSTANGAELIAHLERMRTDATSMWRKDIRAWRTSGKSGDQTLLAVKWDGYLDALDSIDLWLKTRIRQERAQLGLSTKRIEETLHARTERS